MVDTVVCGVVCGSVKSGEQLCRFRTNVLQPRYSTLAITSPHHSVRFNCSRGSGQLRGNF